ncbi:MAG: hypothetical protein ACRDZ4_04920 [Egibacteraceae bacterium]
MGTKGATKRLYGTSTARASTGIDPQDPIDEDMPNTLTGRVTANATFELSGNSVSGMPETSAVLSKERR